MKRDLLLAAGILAAAALLRAFAPVADPDGALALEKIGNRNRELLAGQPAYRHGHSLLLFFEERGFRDDFRGALWIESGFIEDVIVLESREGMMRDAFRDERIIAGYRGQPARAPVIVDSVSGATVSCRALQNAVNERLRAWQEEGHALR
jgi:FMN-binding domain